MDVLCKTDDFWIRFVSVFSLFGQHFRASTTQNDLRATLAPRVLSSSNLLWRHTSVLVRTLSRRPWGFSGSQTCNHTGYRLRRGVHGLRPDPVLDRGWCRLNHRLGEQNSPQEGIGREAVGKPPAHRVAVRLHEGCALAWMWLGLWPAEQILFCWDAPLCSGWPVLARKAAIMLQIS